jgi:hypothetical protein
MVKHAPGEGAKRAPALQGEVDVLARFRLFRLVDAKGARKKLDHCATQPPSIE